MSDYDSARAAGRIAAAQVSRLQRTRNTSSWTAGVLAALRRAQWRAPGADPELWDLVIGPVENAAALKSPPWLRDRAELSIHTSLCLYATHQQSRNSDMHVAGVGLGAAIGRLERARPSTGDGASPVRRRFNAVVTATDLDEVTYHLRGLVAQMRADGIALDYGRLANDLFLIAEPTTADQVRRRWGRDLYRRPAEPAADSTETASIEGAS